MRGEGTANDHPIGAIVRRNVVRLLGLHQWKTSYLYGGMGISAGRFWSQFRLKRGPRLALVGKMAEILDVPIYGLLIDPKPKPLDMEAALIFRSNLRTMPGSRLARMFPESMTDARQGMTCMNFRIWRRVHLYAALIGKTEPEIRAALGVQRATWWTWWRKKSGVAMDDLWRLAAALEVEPWEMLA